MQNLLMTTFHPTAVQRAQLQHLWRASIFVYRHFRLLQKEGMQGTVEQEIRNLRRKESWLLFDMPESLFLSVIERAGRDRLLRGKGFPSSDPILVFKDDLDYDGRILSVPTLGAFPVTNPGGETGKPVMAMFGQLDEQTWNLTLVLESTLSL